MSSSPSSSAPPGGDGSLARVACRACALALAVDLVCASSSCVGKCAGYPSVCVSLRSCGRSCALYLCLDLFVCCFGLCRSGNVVASSAWVLRKPVHAHQGRRWPQPISAHSRATPPSTPDRRKICASGNRLWPLCLWQVLCQRARTVWPRAAARRRTQGPVDGPGATQPPPVYFTPAQRLAMSTGPRRRRPTLAPDALPVNEARQLRQARQLGPSTRPVNFVEPVN